MSRKISKNFVVFVAVFLILGFRIWAEEELTLDQKIGVIQQRLKLEKRNLSLYLELANYLLEADRQKEAISVYEKYYRYGGRDREALKQLWQLCLWNSLEEKAIFYLEAYLKRVPSDIKAVKQLAQLYLWHSNLEKALYWTKRYNRLQLQDKEMLKQEGQLLSWTGRGEEAEEVFGKLLIEKIDFEILKSYGEILKWSETSRFFSKIYPLLYRVKKEKLLREEFYLRYLLLWKYNQVGYLSLAKRDVFILKSLYSNLEDYSFLSSKDWLQLVVDTLKVGKIEVARLFSSALKVIDKDKKYLEYAVLLLRYYENKTYGNLSLIRNFSLKHKFLDGAKFYFENEIEEKGRSSFIDEYPGELDEELNWMFFTFLIKQKDFKRAKNIYAEFSNEYHLLKGRFYLSKNQEEKISAAKEVLLKGDIYDDEVFLYLKKHLKGKDLDFWELYVKRERRKRSLAYLEELRRRVLLVKCEEAYSELIQNLIWLGKREEARSYLKKALKLFPQKRRLIALKWQLEGLPPSLDEKRLEVFLKEGYIDSLTVADYFYNRKNYKKALFLYQKVTPQNSYIQSQIFNCYLNLKNWQEVRNFLNNSSNSRDLTIQQARLEGFRRLSDWRQFREELKRIEKFHPEFRKTESYSYWKMLLEEKLTSRWEASWTAFKDSEKIFYHDYTLRVKSNALERWEVIYRYLSERKTGVSPKIHFHSFTFLKEYFFPANGSLKVGLEGRAYGNDTSSLRPLLEWIRGRGKLYFRYVPLIDTPDAIENSEEEKILGYQGSLALNKKVRMEYNIERGWLFDGNDLWHYRLGYYLKPYPQSQLELAYEHDYLDYKIPDHLDYYSPSDLQTDSYGFNINYRMGRGTGFLALRREYQTTPNEGWSLYNVYSKPLSEDLILKLQISYSSSASGRFQNARYRSNFWNISLEGKF